jgi:hypothetical protein
LFEVPTPNGVFYISPYVDMVGLLSTDDPAGETITGLIIDQNTITVTDVEINSLPPSFPYTLVFGTPTTFTFKIIPSGVIGNSDQIKFNFSILPSGGYVFTYQINELRPQDSITITNNTLPLDFGSLYVGSSSLPVSFTINNQTCKRYVLSCYSDNGDIVINTVPSSLHPNTDYTTDAVWTPSIAEDLSAYSIIAEFAIEDGNIAQGIYGLSGVSTDPPPPIGGTFSNRLIISNSISI